MCMLRTTDHTVWLGCSCFRATPREVLYGPESRKQQRSQPASRVADETAIVAHSRVIVLPFPPVYNPYGRVLT